jgi:hypothetical protein
MRSALVSGELVAITLDECEFVRTVPHRLVVKIGHADHGSERVLMEKPGRFQVVEKFGSADDVIAHRAPCTPRVPGARVAASRLFRARA